MQKQRTAKAFRTLLTATTALVALAATAALADADNPSGEKDAGLENIIVTANKRAENIQSVPTAVTAISAEQLKDYGVTNALDIAQFTPGVQVMAVNSGTTNFFSIRGATEDDFAEHEESPVAVYIDGVYMSTASGTSSLLFDTERVEVLRGPQGTLFGRNATAGAVQYLSKAPTDTPDGYFETSYGNYNSNHSEGAFSDAITPNLSFRLSLANDYMDPWQHNAFYDGRYDSGNSNSHAGRLQFLYKPTEDFDATLNLHGSNLNVRAGLYKYGNVTTDPNNHGLTVFAGPNNGDNLADAIGYCQNCQYPGSNYYTSAAEVLGHNRTDMVGATATLHYRFDGLTLTSISDVSHYTKNYSEDSESSPYPSQQFWTGVNTQQYSEEIHLENDSDERLRWVTGFYYLQMDGRFEQGSGSASGTDIPNAGPNGIGLEDVYTGFSYTPASCPGQFTCQGTDERYTIDTRSWSEFAQAEYDITKDLTLTAGGRWATDTRTLKYDVWGSNSPYAWGPYIAGPPLFSISPSGQYCLGGPCTDGNGNTLALNGNPKLLKSDWSGKVALNYKVTDDIMPYISWSRGIKAGGFSTVSSPSLIAAGAYKYGEEKVYDYEAGVKSEFFDHRLRVNADVFYYDYVGYQAFNTLETAYGQQSFISNNNAKMRGGELEISMRPIPEVTIHQGLAILDADLDDIVAPDGTVRDVHPVQAPRANYTGSIDYTWAVPRSLGSVMAGIDYSWRSTYYYDVQNDPAARQGAFWLVNLHAEYTTEDGQWSVKGYGSNATGTKYLTNVIASAPFYQGVWGAPALYGVRLSYHL